MYPQVTVMYFQVTQQRVIVTYKGIRPVLLLLTLRNYVVMVVRDMYVDVTQRSLLNTETTSDVFGYGNRMGPSLLVPEV